MNAQQQARLSPAQRHQARVLANQANLKSKTGEVMTGSRYELMLYQLVEDKKRLKQIQSVKNKISLKKELLPRYQEWIAGVLQHGQGAQDDVITTLMVWSIDVGEFAQALNIARYVIQHNLTLPDQYERNVATLLLDEFSTAYLQNNMSHKDQAILVLEAILALTKDKDTPDQPRAKLYKALAYAQLASIADQKDTLNETGVKMARKALDHLMTALQLYEGVGVKKDIEQLERRLKKSLH